VVDVHHGERNRRTFDAERLELEAAHRSRRVLDQDLVDGEIDLLTGEDAAADEVRLEQLPREATLATLSAKPSLEGRRLALASVLGRHCRARAPVGPDTREGLIAAARSLADEADGLADRHRVRFEPAFPGATAGPEDVGAPRLVLACALAERDGRPIGTAFTTLIAGRPPSVSVAPPETAWGDGWLPLSR
jgi:hypothetical protein